MAGYASFDEYWSAFVLEHWQRASRQRRLLALGKSLARAAFSLVSPRLSALASLEPLNLRWAAAATLLSLGKSLAGTMDQEVARAGSIETTGVATLALAAEPDRSPETKATEPPPTRAQSAADWAVWM